MQKGGGNYNFYWCKLDLLFFVYFELKKLFLYQVWWDLGHQLIQNVHLWCLVWWSPPIRLVKEAFCFVPTWKITALRHCNYCSKFWAFPPKIQKFKNSKNSKKIQNPESKSKNSKFWTFLLKIQHFKIQHFRDSRCQNPEGTTIS